MPKRPRSPHAARRASFGRAERLRRETDAARPPKTDAPRRQRDDARPERAPRQESRAKPARAASHERRPTPLHRVEERLARSREASDRRSHARLKDQTRSAFNREGERRRDAAGRAEHGRKEQALHQKARRIEEHQRRANVRRLERKRGEMKREFTLKAERRRDVARREAFIRNAADSRARNERQQALDAERQRELQRRAAAAVERDQKRHANDQRDAHRRGTDELRARHKVERNSYRVNENTAMERHHHAVRGIDRREADRLHDFDGRRRGLAGRLAELVPGRRAENDRQRAEIVRGYEAERMTQHREFEGFKERSFDREMKTLRDQALERKALMELHRDERATLTRQQTDDRPRLIEGRALVLERADRDHEQQRERDRADDRGTVRPSGDFARAASGHGRETSTAARDFTPQEGREIVRPAQAFGRG